jgi:hypothetical protein
MTLPGATKDHLSDEETVEETPTIAVSDTRYTKSSFVIRKHLLESADNKARHRNWYEIYLSSENGQLCAYSVTGASLGDNAHRRSVFRLSSISANAPHANSTLPPPVPEPTPSYAIGNNWKVNEFRY